MITSEIRELYNKGCHKRNLDSAIDSVKSYMHAPHDANRVELRNAIFKYLGAAVYDYKSAIADLDASLNPFDLVDSILQALKDHLADVIVKLQLPFNLICIWRMVMNVFDAECMNIRHVILQQGIEEGLKHTAI